MSPMYFINAWVFFNFSWSLIIFFTSCFVVYHTHCLSTGFLFQMLIPVKVKKLVFQVGVICIMLALVVWNMCKMIHLSLILRGFQVHLEKLTVFNQYLETTLNLLLCYNLQKPESCLQSDRIKESKLSILHAVYRLHISMLQIYSYRMNSIVGSILLHILSLFGD